MSETPNPESSTNRLDIVPDNLQEVIAGLGNSDRQRLASFFHDLQDKSKLDDKEGQRSTSEELTALARIYTAYFRKYVEEYQRTRISQDEFRKNNPIEMPDGTTKILKTSAFSRSKR